MGKNKCQQSNISWFRVLEHYWNSGNKSRYWGVDTRRTRKAEGLVVST